ncbi:hypothetical protein EVG20_g8448 [Dentipellis fragilis]|uniref:F-box domain-containing protein n=1 Tax=Dentipellis fragilis TaxID=205917 RepID=A0A4Y9Y5E3_9AGAM|nr:hypothetical protein EVG20_g8448 [Dentipellis fragilis]
MSQARRTLDLEIDAVVLLQCSLRTRYNAVTHVNRLPSEILSHIFGFIQVFDTPRIVQERVCVNTEHDFGWLHITHMDGRVLTSLEDDFDFFRMLHVLLSSENLFGRCPWHHHTTPSPHADLKIMGKVKDKISLPMCLCGAAPVLENVWLTNSASTVHFLRDRQIPSLPTTLFNAAAPRLRHLSISRFNFSWSSLAFGTLTYLEVRQLQTDFPDPSQFAEPQDLRQFLSALERMPLLETLILRFVLPPLPPRRNTSKHYTGIAERIIPWVTSRIPSGGSTLAESDAGHPNLQSPSSGGGPTYELELYGMNFDEDLAELKAMCNLLPLGHIDKLKIGFEDGDPWIAEDYFSLFGRCEELRHVEISLACTASFWEGFSPDVAGSMEEHPRVLFPSLTSLTLSRVNFKPRHSSWLPGWLKSRGSSFPLQQITLTNCVLQREASEIIKRDLTQVVWDHVRFREQDDDSDYDVPPPLSPLH